MRVWVALLVVVLLASPLRAEPEPKPTAGAFPVALRSYLRDVVEELTRLEERKAPPKSRLWMWALRRQLEVAQQLVATRPKPLALSEPLMAAHAAWERARLDTREVYLGLSKAAKTKELVADFCVRSHGLAIGYRNASREALSAFTSKEALAAYPDTGSGLPGRSELEAPVTKGTSIAMCKLAGKFVRAQQKREAREDAHRLTKIDKQSILVVDSEYDHIALTLNALRLPYTKITPYDLKPETFKQHKLVLWGCGEPLPHKRMRRLSPALRRFVEDGGHLYTTDWAVEHVLKTVVPEHLDSSGPAGKTEEMVVGVLAPKAVAKHALLRGVLRPDVKTLVWLERAWFPIRAGTTAPKSMKMLLTAPQIRKSLNQDPVIAVTFPLGKGHVLHVVPMSYQEVGNLAGVMATQRLLLNFICQALPDE